VVGIKQVSPEPKHMGVFAFNSSEFYKVMPEGEYLYTITEKNKNKSKTIRVRIERDAIADNGNYTVLN
jgi:hypothetical protein